MHRRLLQMLLLAEGVVVVVEQGEGRRGMEPIWQGRRGQCRGQQRGRSGRTLR